MLPGQNSATLICKSSNRVVRRAFFDKEQITVAPPKKQQPVETVNMQDLGKGKALETTLANLNKKYGEGVVMKLGEATKLNVEAIPSGSLSLDIALGVGGYPKGRIIEIYGPESSGKTTLCLHAIAEAQKQGGI